MPVPIIAALASAVPAAVKAGGGIVKQVSADKAAGRETTVMGVLNAGLNPKSVGAGANSTRNTTASTPAPATSPRPRTSTGPTEAQKAMVAVIAREFAAAQLPASLQSARKALTVAALVNAYAESRWDARARNLTPREDSVGLFQANRRGGLGQGFTVAQLQDPTTNTRLVIREVRARAAQLAPAAQRGSLADLVAAFTVHVERPAQSELRGRERAAIARSWLGSRADQRAWGWG